MMKVYIVGDEDSTHSIWESEELANEYVELFYKVNHYRYTVIEKEIKSKEDLPEINVYWSAEYCFKTDSISTRECLTFNKIKEKVWSFSTRLSAQAATEEKAINLLEEEIKKYNHIHVVIIDCKTREIVKQYTKAREYLGADFKVHRIYGESNDIVKYGVWSRISTDHALSIAYNLVGKD